MLSASAPSLYSTTAVDAALTANAVFRSSLAVSRLFENSAGLSDEEQADYDADGVEPDTYDSDQACTCDPPDFRLRPCYVPRDSLGFAAWAGDIPTGPDTPPNNADVLRRQDRHYAPSPGAPALPRPVYDRPTVEAERCAYIYDGADTDGTDWHLCTVHGEQAPSPDAPCAGYRAPAYTP